jgi:hypothetical protein
MLGDSENTNFTLDSDGEWQKEHGYSTVGSHVEATGEVTAPANFADGTSAIWNIKVESNISPEYKKEYDNVPTGTPVSFSIPTNFGDTKITIKIWSTRGGVDEGCGGTIQMSD